MFNYVGECITATSRLGQEKKRFAKHKQKRTGNERNCFVWNNQQTQRNCSGAQRGNVSEHTYPVTSTYYRACTDVHTQYTVQ